MSDEPGRIQLNYSVVTPEYSLRPEVREKVESLARRINDPQDLEDGLLAVDAERQTQAIVRIVTKALVQSVVARVVKEAQGQG